MSDDAPRLGWKTPAVVLGFYVTCVVVATYPAIGSVTTSLPDRLDPLQHLWIMRWYKTCLLEGRSPVLCPEIQHPVGAPLGNFSPLHFQSLMYLPLSLIIANDALCYNLIWLFGLVTTGLGTFLLIWCVLHDRGCAAVGGMLAMLSAPMMIHARGHLELIHLGCFPLFLAAWTRFVDRPDRARLAGAVGAFLLVALCAAYYLVFSTIPATLYVVWRWAGAREEGRWAWLKGRLGWLLRFIAWALPCVLLVFANQIWAKARGYSGPRPMSEFSGYGAPPWTYLAPTTLHALGRRLPVNIYDRAGFGWSVGERASYLGVVTLALVAYAAARRVRFARAGFWWAALATMIVLGWGASATIGPHQVPLPALFLKKYVFIFQPIRVPARFNLLVGVVAAVIAAAGLKHALERVGGARRRGALLVAVTLVALCDLSTTPFPATVLPPPPAAYEFIRGRDPGATILDAPQFQSGGSALSSVCGYWQTSHRLRTSAGYSGQSNIRLDNLCYWSSPFQAKRLEDPEYLKTTTGLAVEVAINVDFADYAWLYLTAHQIDYVVLHQWSGAVPEHPVHLDRLKAALAPARVFEDRDTVVYERARMRPPGRPVLLTMAGWRPAWDGRLLRVVGREAKVAVYNTDPGRDLLFALEAKGFRRPRTVRLKSRGVELARWVCRPGVWETQWSPTFRLPAGLQQLTIETDGESPPNGVAEAALEWDTAPYSLKVGGVALVHLPTPAVQVATQPADTPRRNE